MGSEIDNPYAPPKTERLEAERRLDSPDQAWRDRKLLVVRKKGAVLPDRCLKCNAPAEGYLFTRDISWIKPIWVILVLLSPLLFILAYFFVRWTGKVSVGLCPRHRQAQADDRAGMAHSALGVGHIRPCDGAFRQWRGRQCSHGFRFADRGIGRRSVGLKSAAPDQDR